MALETFPITPNKETAILTLKTTTVFICRIHGNYREIFFYCNTVKSLIKNEQQQRQQQQQRYSVQS